MKKTILCLLPLLGSLLPSSLFGETNIGAGHEYDNIRLSGPVLHAEKSLPASLRLLPNQTIRTYNAEMFGLAYDFAEQDKTGMAAAVDGAPFPRILPDFQNVMRGVPLPFNRIWFRKDNWKYSTPFDDCRNLETLTFSRSAKIEAIDLSEVPNLKRVVVSCPIKVSVKPSST